MIPFGNVSTKGFEILVDSQQQEVKIDPQSDRQVAYQKVQAPYHNVIGLYHRKSAVFDVIRPHLLIKSSLPFTSAHAPALSGLFHRSS